MDIKKTVTLFDNVKKIGGAIIIIGALGFPTYEAIKIVNILKDAVSKQHITDLNQKSSMLAMNNELKALISYRNSRIDVKLAIIQKSVQQNHKDYLAIKKTIDDFIKRFVMVRTR